MEFGDGLELGLPCVHCGLCLDTCPTYKISGSEAASPRGRIYIMEAIGAGELAFDDEAAGHLETCLGCRACESACPSGVDYSRRIDEFRPRLAASKRRSELWRKFSRRLHGNTRIFDVGLKAARVVDSLGLRRLRRRIPFFSLLPGRTASSNGVELSPLQRSNVHQPPYPRARVALLRGCIADRAMPGLNRDAVEVLQRNGIEIVELHDQVCCGALDLHEGRRSEALALARANVDIFSGALQRGEVDFVVSTAAGCGAQLREYGKLLGGDSDYREAAALLSERHRDICELLVELGFEKPRAPGATAGGKAGALAYHDACHLLHGCKVEAAPRAICEAATGTAPLDLGENSICCGSAGTYNLQQRTMAGRLGARKAELARISGAGVIAVANVGCMLQLSRALDLAGLRIEVRHPIELLAQAYRGSPGAKAGPEAKR